MIEKMTKYIFILVGGENEGFIEKISELGLIDISRGNKSADEKILEILGEIDRLKKKAGAEYAALANKLKLTTDLLKKREIWGEFDPKKLRSLEEAGTAVRFYQIPEKKYNPEWGGFVISSGDGMINFVLIGDDCSLPIESVGTPDESLSSLREEKAGLKKELSRMKSEPSEEDLAQIKVLEHRMEVLLAENSSIKAADGILTIYTGFAPSSEDERIEKALDSLGVYYSREKASMEDNPPIKLRNNPFVKQFEVLTGMYGLPVYNEFDPTIFLSIFFLLFFAMCMGDAGYGILLILIGLALKGKKGGLAEMWTLIVTLGAGTLVVGFVMGGFFGMDLSTVEWLPASIRSHMLTGNIEVGGSSYSLQMAISLIIGILHICLALIMKAVWAVKQSGFKESLSAVGWTLLIVGGVIGLGLGLAGLVSENTMKLTLIAIAAVSALGIFIFNKWGRNPLINIGSGLWDTYSMASGLMGDVLSYIRLYALGLSGGMLGSTFNQIAEMVKGSDPTWQWLPFILIILVGHALNLAMSCLGAFVHPLRLNFVEFFKNSAYQGRGNLYRPLVK